MIRSCLEEHYDKLKWLERCGWTQDFPASKWTKGKKVMTDEGLFNTDLYNLIDMIWDGKFTPLKDKSEVDFIQPYYPKFERGEE